MKFKLFLYLLLVTLVSGQVFAREWKEVNVKGFSFRWLVNGQNLEVELSAKATGWISVGFKPSKVMKDSNIIIGYIENGKAVVSEHFGTGMFAHVCPHAGLML